MDPWLKVSIFFCRTRIGLGVLEKRWSDRFWSWLMASLTWERSVSRVLFKSTKVYLSYLSHFWFCYRSWVEILLNYSLALAICLETYCLRSRSSLAFLCLSSLTLSSRWLIEYLKASIYWSFLLCREYSWPFISSFWAIHFMLMSWCWAFKLCLNSCSICPSRIWSFYCFCRLALSYSWWEMSSLWSVCLRRENSWRVGDGEVKECR